MSEVFNVIGEKRSFLHEYSWLLKSMDANIPGYVGVKAHVRWKSALVRIGTVAKEALSRVEELEKENADLKHRLEEMK